MNVKVTGITSMKELQQLDGLNVDFAGLIFFKPSPRFAGDRFKPGEIKAADLDIKTVGIFANAEYDEILQTAEKFGLDMVQLNGDETPDLCDDLSGQIEVIKTFRIDDGNTKVDQLVKAFDDSCDYYLFDTAPKKGVGSEGKKFDWTKVSTAKIEKPFFLAGGIGPDDAALVSNFRHPDLYCVDLNSHFEKEPGIKDMSLVLRFMHGLKQNR